MCATSSAKTFILKVLYDLILQLYLKDMLDGSFLKYVLGQISASFFSYCEHHENVSCLRGVFQKYSCGHEEMTQI